MINAKFKGFLFGVDLKIKLFGLAGAIALISMAAACTPQAPTAPSESDSVSESSTTAPESEIAAESAASGEGRATYSEVPLPPADQRVGAAPQEIALDAFGMEDPGEGDFAQEVTVDEQTTTDAVVILTQTGLPDDSVEGMRYRLEFAAAENQWEKDQDAPIY